MATLFRENGIDHEKVNYFNEPFTEATLTRLAAKAGVRPIKLTRGAAAAGTLVQLADTIGIGIVLIAFPVCFFVFYSYRMYLQNVEISMEKADEAGKYAQLLESQSNMLRESEERFRSAFNYAPIGIGLVSGSGEWLKTNFAMSEILGYSEDEFRRLNFQEVIMREDLGATLVKVHEILAGRAATASKTAGSSGTFPTAGYGSAEDWRFS